MKRSFLLSSLPSCLSLSPSLVPPEMNTICIFQASRSNSLLLACALYHETRDQVLNQEGEPSQSHYEGGGAHYAQATKWGQLGRRQVFSSKESSLK